MIIYPKLPDWRERLDQFIALTTRRGFEPGAHDCALFADGAFEAQTGHSFSSEFAGRYQSLEEGLKLLQAAGYANHVALVVEKLPEIPVSLARIGDIAVVEFPGADPALTVVGGHRLHGVMPGQRATVPLTLAVRAFAVGRPAEEI